MFTSNSVRFALGAWFHSGHSARKDKTLRRAPRGAPGVTLELLEARELFAAAPVLDSSAHSTVFGQGITLTALLAGGSGVVTFLDGTSPLGTGTLDPAGKATIFTSSLAVGTHSITASHDGAASAPVTQVVNPALTITALSSSAGMVSHPILRPDHVVIVVEEDRAAQAVGDPTTMPYLNQLASTGLVYNNSHGVNARGQLFGEMNYLALYSGSTQGVTDDGPLYTFSGPNLAKSLHDAGLSFTSYAETLPAAGDVTTVFAADPSNLLATDAYARYYNPAAMFTDVGAGKSNADVNRPFSDFPIDFSALPTVSLVIPNRLHNTHGSNETPPFANDPDTYNPLRQTADAWLKNNLAGYVEWAKTHNSLLMVTTESGNRDGNFAAGGTTLVNGDPRLFVSGVNSSFVTHYDALRTLETMYGLPLIGDSATAAVFDTDPAGKLSPAGPVAVTLLPGESETYTAAVAPIAPAAGMPTGTVQFRVDGAAFGAPVALSSGAATVNFSGLAAGTHRISATYRGDLSYQGSDSRAVSQEVGRNVTTTALTGGAASVAAGQPVTFTAMVSGSVPGPGPTGVVTFRQGTVVLGSVPLGATGEATFITNSLPVGTHFITASYGGDAANAPSDSPVLTQSISPNATTITLTSSASTANAGQNVVFTAIVAPSSPAVALKPGGTVTFFDGATRFGTGAVDAATGKATFATSGLTVGSHSITALYSGNASFSGSLSAPIIQQITTVPTPTPTGPPNDNFAKRMTLAGGAPTTTGTNVGATKEVGEPRHGGKAGGKSLWWSWKAPKSGLVTVETLGSSFKTLLGVYTGSALNALTKVEGTALTVGGAATFTFKAKAGKTYQIAVDGVDGASGNIKLGIRSAAPPKVEDDDADKGGNKGNSGKDDGTKDKGNAKALKQKQKKGNSKT